MSLSPTHFSENGESVQLKLRNTCFFLLRTSLNLPPLSHPCLPSQRRRYLCRSVSAKEAVWAGGLKRTQTLKLSRPEFKSCFCFLVNVALSEILYPSEPRFPLLTSCNEKHLMLPAHFSPSHPRKLPLTHGSEPLLPWAVPSHTDTGFGHEA